MKLSQTVQLLLAVTAISNFFPSSSVLALSFGEKELDQNQFAVVAAPYHHGYNLLILEQIPGQRPCWGEIGANPTVVQPLFLDFDFTNACIRSSDSNSYSIRFDDRDYGLDYLLNVVEREGELHLVGTPRDSTKPELQLGRTYGLSSGSIKIRLNPEWRLTKRTYQGSTTEHIYLSHNSSEKEELLSQSVPTTEAHNQESSNPQINYQQPVTYPAQSQVGNVYQQPVTYPAQSQVENLYQQPVTYPAQSQVGNVYQQPVTYPTPQPMGNVYQQPVTYPATPINVNHQQ